jgi:hypothetical protein
MQIGDPIGEGWAIYKRFWQHLLPLAFFTYLIISLIALFFSHLGGVLGGLASVVIAIAGVFLLQSALVEAVADVRDGRADLTFTETLARVWPRLGAVILAGILAGLGVAIGFVLFIVPGFYLVTVWSVVVPVLILERTSALDSFGRSRELVRGYGWTVFGVIIVTFAVNLVATIVVGILLSGFSTGVSHYLGNVIANTLIAPFVAATWTCMYFRLHALHEPPPTQAQAAA